MTIKSNSENLQNSVSVRLFFIGFIILILHIPLLMVWNIIAERQERHANVIYEIGETWGRPQLIIGPILTVPYSVYWKDNKGEMHSKRQYIYLLPDELQISGDINTEVRYRGIFESVVYRTALTLQGRFPALNPNEWNISPEDISWGESIVSFGVSDTRGIREELRLSWDEDSLEFLAGSGLPKDYFSNGLHAKLPLLAVNTAQAHSFSLNLNLNGHDNLKFVPVGKKTVVHLTSKWADPSFMGEFLPINREITADGFKADWQISYLARNYPQYWLNEDFNSQLHSTDFGVTLLIPVDFYQKTERSIKYGILFLVLTFLLFFLFEIFNPLRIHLFQYLLVGSALVLFYLLLLSISEHLGFMFAYFIGSIATILLIGGYASKVLASRQRAAWLMAALAILYFYLYVLLHLQDYSLLLGTLGLFAVLASIMYITRNIDWYAVNFQFSTEKKSSNSPPPQKT